MKLVAIAGVLVVTVLLVVHTKRHHFGWWTVAITGILILAVTLIIGIDPGTGFL